MNMQKRHKMKWGMFNLKQYKNLIYEKQKQTKIDVSLPYKCKREIKLTHITF